MAAPAALIATSAWEPAAVKVNLKAPAGVDGFGERLGFGDLAGVVADRRRGRS